MSGKMVWWSTEPNWSTKLGDLTGCLILTLATVVCGVFVVQRYQIDRIVFCQNK